MAPPLVPRPNDSFPGRETIYLLRGIHQNQNQLIALADQKANILISIVAVVITILSTNINTIQQFHPLLMFFVFAFLGAEFLTIGLGLLVIFPANIQSPFKHKLFNRKTSPQKPKKMMPPNPIFFGSFLQLPEQEFVETLFGQINDVNKVRRLFLVDIYRTGLVLQRKYMLLKYAYASMISGLCFLVCLIFMALLGGDLGA